MKDSKAEKMTEPYHSSRMKVRSLWPLPQIDFQCFFPVLGLFFYANSGQVDLSHTTPSFVHRMQVRWPIPWWMSFAVMRALALFRLLCWWLDDANPVFPFAWPPKVMTVAKLAQGSGDFLKDLRSGQSIIDWNIIVMMVGWCGVLRRCFRVAVCSTVCRHGMVAGQIICWFFGTFFQTKLESQRGLPSQVGTLLGKTPWFEFWWFLIFLKRA